jgi:hypothetical protein
LKKRVEVLEKMVNGYKDMLIKMEADLAAYKMLPAEMSEL